MTTDYCELRKMRMNMGAFTLLELIIVIIIVGVLASVALPRFFKAIEFSRSTEALVNLKVLRDAVERKYMLTGDLTQTCLVDPFNAEQHYQCLGMDNLDQAPNAHFAYRVLWMAPTEYEIVAARNTLSGGTAGDRISLYIKLDTSNDVSYCGTGAFKSFSQASTCPP